jgi:NADP-dependent 3-hydroxy acid dehydrogenase YdfG
VARRRSLDGQVVAITGAARGLGRAMAVGFAERGARVAIGDVDADLAAATAAEIGRGTVALPLDVTRRPSFESFIRETEARLGSIDVLVNNAGIMPIGPLAVEDDATTRRILDINVGGVLLGAKLVLPAMVARRSGHLVNIASIAGKVGVAAEVTYCASKHAVVGLSEALRQELHGTGVEITCVMPNLARTELASGMRPARFTRLITPEEVAAAVVGAVERPRFDVFVPREIGVLHFATMLMPRAARELATRAIGVHRVATIVDESARAAYVSRVSSDVTPASAEEAPAVPSGS